MDKKLKTTLIVALSLFGAGIIICFCVAMSANFDLTKLSSNFQDSASSSSNAKTEHIDKSIEASGQNISLTVGSADIRLEKSADDEIHISYTNTEDSYFELKSSSSKIVLTQYQNGGHFFIFGFFGSIDGERSEVVVSIPAENIGGLDIDVASGEVSASDIELSGDFGIDTASGDVSLEKSTFGEFSANSASGEITLSDVKTKGIDVDTASGGVSLSKIAGNIPVTLDTVSGEVYIEDVEADEMRISTVSGDISLSKSSGKAVGFSTTSGGVELSSADFKEISFVTVSGDINGTVSGDSDDYTVYADTISGSNSLSSHKGRGQRTIELSSTSGSFDISFEK